MSLFNKEGQNIFVDENDKNGLSKEAYNFIAGLMKHMRSMTAIINPIVNSYKRLVPGYEAPTYKMCIRDRFFTAAFFPQNGTIVMIGLYFTGIIVAILYALVLDKTKFKGEPVPFVMELPNYRMPGAKSVLRLIWDKAKDFITRTFTVIFIASLIIWFLQTFSITFNIVSDSKDSILALIGGVIAPIFAPLGFGDWRASTALITGFTAKESVVSTMTVLLGGSPVATMFNTHNAIVRCV